MKEPDRYTFSYGNTYPFKSEHGKYVLYEDYVNFCNEIIGLGVKKAIDVQDLLDTVQACLIAAGGSSNIDELEKQLKDVGTNPSHFIKKRFQDLEKENNELKGEIIKLNEELRDFSIL